MNVVIVLGKRLNDDGTMKEELVKRLELGIKTYNENNADILCVAGGMPNKRAKATEASKMFEYLLGHGFDSNKIIIEDHSLTTFGNAFYLKKALKKQNVTKIYLVSSAYHFTRRLGNCYTIFKNRFHKTEIIKCESEE